MSRSIFGRARRADAVASEGTGAEADATAAPNQPAGATPSRPVEAGSIDADRIGAATVARPASHRANDSATPPAPVRALLLPGLSVHDGGDEPAEPAESRRRGMPARLLLAGVAAVALLAPLAHLISTARGDEAARAAAVPAAVAAHPWLTGSPSSTARPAAASVGPGQPTATNPTGPSGQAVLPQLTATAAAASTGQAASVVATTAPPTGGRTTTSSSTVVTGLAGPGCANDNTHNWYTNAFSASWSQTSGGASGCGQALAMPMSRNAGYDTSPYVVWWFVTKPLTTGACSVAVYIPTGAAADVAGRPATYKVLGGRTSSTVKASFTIDQTANRGRWVTAGPFPLRDGELSVHLANRGAGTGGQRIGVAQVSLRCTAG